MATAEAERPRNPSRSFTLGQATATEDQPEDVASSFGRTFSMVADSVNPASLMDAFEGDESREDSEAGGGGLGLPDVLSGHPTAAYAPIELEAKSQAAISKRAAKAKVLKDKEVFVLGLANLAVSCFWLGRSPSNFYIYYTFKCLLLFGLRIPFYLKQKTHYYFFDFCYVVNALLVLHCWVQRLWANVWLWKALFACCAGPLAWSIPALRNSLVLHDLEKTTSVFMHWSPAVVAWSLRWYPPPTHPAYCSPGAESCPLQEARLLEIGLAPFSVYILWSVGYYLKIFVIRERGYDTVYSYMMNKGGMGKAFEGIPPKLRPVAYLVGHCGVCMVAFMLSWFFYRSFYAHCIFLAFVSLVATWNGSCFYFDYFAFRYVPSLGLEHKNRSDSSKKSE